MEFTLSKKSTEYHLVQNKCVCVLHMQRNVFLTGSWEHMYIPSIISSFLTMGKILTIWLSSSITPVINQANCFLKLNNSVVKINSMNLSLVILYFSYNIAPVFQSKNWYLHRFHTRTVFNDASAETFYLELFQKSICVRTSKLICLEKNTFTAFTRARHH